MILRKINAVLSLITSTLLLDHAISHALWMLSGGAIAKSPICTPWILFWFMMVHAFICIMFGILGHKGAIKGNYNDYPNLNKTIFMQRISGVSLILFTLLHVAGTVGILQPPKLVHAILPPLFFAICMLHTAISTSKAFISLGIGSAGFVKKADIVIKIICAVILIADVIGFYIYLG